MRALAGSPGVRVPAVYFEDDGAPPEVSPFHAMNIVPGECLEPILTEVSPEKLPLVPERAFAAARDARRAAPSRPRSDRPRRREALHARRRDPALDACVRDRRRAHEHAVPRGREAALRHDAPGAPNAVCTATTASATCCATAPRSPRSSTGRSGRSRTRDSTSPGSCSSPTRRSTRWRATPDRRACRPRRRCSRVRRGTGRRRPADLEWFHCLIRYKEAAATALLMKRMVKAGGDDGRRMGPIPPLTVECIDRLKAFTPA